jgi:hypothetical protein
MVMRDLICAEHYCNLHDWEMVIDDENGKRPRGRNPWDGFCLRIDALKRISNKRLEALTVNEFTPVQQVIQKVVPHAPAPHQKQSKTRKGGTPGL